MAGLFQNIFSRTQTREDAIALIANLEEQARAEPQRAPSLYRKAAGIASHHGLRKAEAQNNYRLGLLLHTARTTKKAEAALFRATEIWEDLGQHLKAGDAYLARAGVCLMDRRIDAAQTFANKAGEHYRAASIPPDRPQLTRLLSAIAAMRTTPL